MSTISTDFVVGGVVRNEDYHFHKALIRELWELLKKNNVLLLSPRRTGKTSAMYRMLDYPKNGYHVIHLNVEDIDTPAEFYLSLVDAINQHQPEYLKKLSSSWSLLKNLGNRIGEINFLDFKVTLRDSLDWEKQWKEYARQLMEKVIGAGEPVLFIIDELPDMLISMDDHSTDQFKEFLHQFRKIRTDSKANKIRWLVGGSVNIRGTLDERGLIKLINDLHTEALPTIQPSEIKEFVRSMLLSRGVKFDESLIPRIHALLGAPIPYFLQLFTQELYRYWRREAPAVLNTDCADEVFQKSLLGESAQDKLQHYHSRIRLYYPDNEQEIAYLLLDAISRSENGVSETVLLNQYRQAQQKTPKSINSWSTQQSLRRLLLRLQSDFYISKQQNEFYDFSSFLLKTWWKKNWTQK